MRTNNFNFDAAPPLGVAMSFFVTAPVFVALAGALVMLRSETILLSPWAPETIALTHLGTLGWLLMVMVGAFYQLAPVVAGAPLPWTPLARVVHLIVTASVFGFALFGVTQNGVVLAYSSRSLSVGVTLFVSIAAIALVRTRASNITVWGMRTVVLSLLFTATLGLLMSQGYAGAGFPGDRGTWIQLHLSQGLLCWVGGLITAVSWQVVPMFYLAKDFKRAQQRWILAGVVFSTLALPLTLFVPAGLLDLAPLTLLVITALPADASIWLLHPWVILRTLSKRRRRRADATLQFWQMAMMTSPLVGAGAVAALLSSDPRFTLAFGFLAIWSWAGGVMHGMLHRIVPFLIWLNWLADLVGRGRLPTTRQLIPNERTLVCLQLHLATSLVGLLAIFFPAWPLVFALGLMLSLTGSAMLRAFMSALVMGHKARERLRVLPVRDKTEPHH